jgi:hypothetical protein
MSVLRRHHPPEPDPALLARVTEATEVDLGTYPEDALAVVGAYPARGALDRWPGGLSSFRRLDGEARRAAMQAALDRLAAEGTLQVPPGADLTGIVADGLDGKLAVNGQLAELYRLSWWFHRHGFQAGMVVSMATSDGLRGVQMPYGVSAPGLETCFCLPPAGNGGAIVLLVERPDNEAGTRTYTLRTVRQEFTRVAAFLFADVTTEGEALLAGSNMTFRFGEASLKIGTNFVRKDGADVAYGQVITKTTLRNRKKKEEEPRYVKASPSELVDRMTNYFVTAMARTR